MADALTKARLQLRRDAQDLAFAARALATMLDEPTSIAEELATLETAIEIYRSSLNEYTEASLDHMAAQDAPAES